MRKTISSGTRTMRDSVRPIGRFTPRLSTASGPACPPSPNYPPLANGDALFERRLCRRHPLLGVARRGPSRPPSAVARRLCRRSSFGWSPARCRAPAPRTARLPKLPGGVRKGGGAPRRARSRPVPERADLESQGVEVDEALRVPLPIDLVGLERGEVAPVERPARAPPGD